MNKTLIKRIRQINNDIIPKGYKKTKVGIVPVEWDIVKLSSIMHNEQRPIEKPNEPYVRVGIRSHAKGTFHELIENPADINMDTLYVVKKDDFILNISFAWEHAIALADENDENKLVSHRFPTYVFDNNSPVYYKYVFCQDMFRQKLELISPGGAGRNRVLNKTDFLNLEMYRPPLPEQQKIAEILGAQDKLIELQERKINQLKTLKKGYLQKMFPKKGSKYPELRFKGFTDAWKQRKLGNVGSCQSGIGFPDAEQGGTEGIPFFKVSDMNISGNEYELLYSNNYVTQEQIERKKWKPITEVPAMFFAKVGAAVMLNRKRMVKTPFLLDNNTMAYKFGEGWDTNFGRALFDTINLASLVQVGTLPSYNASDVEGIEISLPSIEEQIKIGQCFTNLDHLITLHQRKLDEEKQKKKALMQLLLTGKVRVIP